MATYQKFEPFVLALASKKHNLTSDTLKVAYVSSANLPDGTEAVLADLTEISYTFCSSRTLVIDSATQTGGLFSLVLDDLTITATGGAVGPFQGVIIYNDTAAADDLIGFFDLGAEVTLADTQEFFNDFNNIDGLFDLQ